MKLSKSRQKWVDQRADPKLVGDVLNYPSAIMSRYQKQLQSLSHTMAVDYQRRIDKLWKEFGGTGTQDASLASQVRILLSELNRKWEKIFVDRSRKLANGMVGQVSKYSEKSVNSSLKQLSGGLTLKAPVMPESLQDAVKASITQNVSLIRNIQGQFAQRIESSVLSSIQTGGAGSKQIYDDLLKIDGMTQRRAKVIADDQTRKVTSAMNDARMQAAGVEEFEWIHSGRLEGARELHVELDGQIFRYDDPPVIDERTGERGLPGKLINCHPGDSIINFADGCNKLYRRIYSGELLSIVTDDGIVLEATPNHPILTHRGWLALKDINLGDYVVNARNQGFNIGEANVQNLETTFADFFDSAAALIGITKADVGRSALEFHGDGSDNEVDIISITGNLSVELDIHGCEYVAELLLSFASNSGGIAIIEPCDGSLDHFFMGIGFPPKSGVRSLYPLLTLLRSKLAGAEDACLTLSSYLDSCVCENSSNDSATHIELFSDFVFRNAATVEGRNNIAREIVLIMCSTLAGIKGNSIDSEFFGEIIGIAFEDEGNVLDGSLPIEKFSRVIEKGSRIFNGRHVYNLENEKSWYSVNGIVTHNCACKARPILRFGNNNE